MSGARRLVMDYVVERLSDRMQGASVLDLGSGNAEFPDVFRRLGAKRVLATDIDLLRLTAPSPIDRYTTIERRFLDMSCRPWPIS